VFENNTNKYRLDPVTSKFIFLYTFRNTEDRDIQIVLFILCGCLMWSVTLKKEYITSVLKQSALKNIYT
jgi:hypothetical protein